MADTPPVESPTDLVLTKNPKLPDSAPARMSRESYELSFRGQGFILVGDDGEPLEPTAKAKTPAGGASA